MDKQNTGNKNLKILINAITLDSANLVPLFMRLKHWKEQGMEVTIFGNEYLKERLSARGLLDGYNYLLLHSRLIRQQDLKNIKSKFHFIWECLKRNIVALYYARGQKNKFDLVYSLSSVLDLTVFPYVLKLNDRKIKWAVVFDNTVSSKQFLAWIFFRISIWLIRKADVVFTIDLGLKDFLTQNGINTEKIIPRGNGLEIELIEKAKKRKEYNFDALFVGRINEAKGIFDLLKVLESVTETYPDFQLAIMGDGDNVTKNKFRKKISERSLASNINFLGYRSGQEKFDIIKSSKCFLFLSRSESFGIALLEAVCSEIPVFAYDLPAYSRIYKSGEVDISPKGDWELVAEKVIRLFERGNFRNEKGKKLLGKYSWENIAEIEYREIKKILG